MRHVRAVSSRGGKRADLDDRYFRSKWEANYARYLNLLAKLGKIAAWEYEPKTFLFETVKRGNREYTPDFRIENKDGTHEWHEVKGWMDPSSATKLKRMGQFFPDERVIVIGKAWFAQARRGGLAGAVQNWE